MIKMYRSFNTVGQGAFYTETFKIEGSNKNINIVYDCGSLTKGISMDYKIKQTFDKGEEITAVFISHLDKDHVNGLEYLLDYCSVKNLFLPLIQEPDKVLLLLYLKANGVSQSSFLYSFVENPSETVKKISEETRIIKVNEFDEESKNKESQEDFQDFYLDSDIKYSEEIDSNKINSGRRCKIKSLTDWVYVPFNYREETRHKQLMDSFKKNGITPPSSSSETLKFYIKNSQKLNNIYRSPSISGSINTNSMVVYSGPTSESNTFMHCFSRFCNPRYHYLRCRHLRCLEYEFFKVGCLYTGDYDASGKDKWNNLKESFKEYWELVGTWQIPHHGAKSSYNPEIAKHMRENEACIAIVSAGSSNMYGHPHVFVVRDLFLNGINLFVVTENMDSQADFVICNIK